MKQLLIMAVIVLAGYFFARKFKVSEQEQKFLSKLLLYFVNPSLVLTSFNIDFNLEKFKQFFFVAFLALIIHGAMILIALLFTSKKDFRKNKTYADVNGEKTDSFKDYSIIERVALVFTNCGFVGIPLIRGVFGEEGVFYLMGYLVVFNILLWTFGYYQMSSSVNIKKILLNPNIIAVCLGLLIFALPYKLPEFISKPIEMVGDMNTATSMILLGILLANLKIPQASVEFSRKDYLLRIVKFVLVRLVLCALVNIFILYFVHKGLHFMADIKLIVFVILICSMCPSATSVPSMACIFNKDESYASLLVSITSIACIITTPSFVALAEFFIK